MHMCFCSTFVPRVDRPQEFAFAMVEGGSQRRWIQATAEADQKEIAFTVQYVELLPDDSVPSRLVSASFPCCCSSHRFRPSNFPGRRGTKGAQSTSAGTLPEGCRMTPGWLCVETEVWIRRHFRCLASQAAILASTCLEY
eukprot:symbB.v1.2.022323.t1/scaffold1975.1/size94033/10